MKAITLTQPWASLIALGEKQVETRSWACYYTGPIAIHAAKTYRKREFADMCHREPFYSSLRVPNGRDGKYCWPEEVIGHVIAIGHVYACIRTEIARLNLTEKEKAFGNYADGRWAIYFEKVRRIVPVKATGALMLWEWNDTYTFLDEVKNVIPDTNAARPAGA